MSLSDLKETLRQTAKRILKASKPTGPEVLQDIENSVVNTFNQISTKASTLLPTKEVTDTFTYSRKKAIECFIALQVTYIVPKEIGQLIDKNVSLVEDDTYSVVSAKSDSEADTLTEEEKARRKQSIEQLKKEKEEKELKRKLQEAERGKKRVMEQLKINKYAYNTTPAWDGNPQSKGVFLSAINIIRTIATDTNVAGLIAIVASKISDDVLRGAVERCTTFEEVERTVTARVSSRDPLEVLSKMQLLLRGISRQPSELEQLKQLGCTLASIYLERGVPLDMANELAASEMVKAALVNSTTGSLRATFLANMPKSPDAVVRQMLLHATLAPESVFSGAASSNYRGHKFRGGRERYRRPFRRSYRQHNSDDRDNYRGRGHNSNRGNRNYRRNWRTGGRRWRGESMAVAAIQHNETPKN